MSTDDLSSYPVYNYERQFTCAECAASYYRVSASNLEESMTADEVVQAVREGHSLAGQDLSCLNLSKTNLRNAELVGANLSECNLQGADLRGADLSDANLFKADLRGARLRHANLTRANRMLAKIRKWALKGTYIAGPTAYTEE